MFFFVNNYLYKHSFNKIILILYCKIFKSTDPNGTYIYSILQGSFTAPDNPNFYKLIWQISKLFLISRFMIY